MKKIFIISFLLIFLGLSNPSTLFAQPINDHVCNALQLIIDDTPITISNIGATTEIGEEVVTPPHKTDCSPGGWCDSSGSGGQSGIDNSVWFKFIAPASTAVLIDICNSDFNTQLALYSLTDCADFNTFTYIYGNDHTMGCLKSSTLRIECLNPGEEYYILVDEWENSSGTALTGGDIIIEVKDQTPVNSVGITIISPFIDPPICPGEANASVDLTLLNGIAPITYLWSDGSSNQDLMDVSQGTYTVTITDYCGHTFETSITIEDPPAPVPITLLDTNDPFSLDNSFSQAINCVRGGQINLPVFTGTAPFTYQWEHGPTSAILDSLEDGIYKVTISDACQIGGTTLVQEFVVETNKSNNTPTAGPDLVLNGCTHTQIGFDNVYDGEQGLRFTHNIDQMRDGGNVHCRQPSDPWPMATNVLRSALWRSFDLSDFDIPDGAKLKGMEVFLNCVANSFASDPFAYYEPGLPMSFTLQNASTTELDNPELLLTMVDSVTTYIPTTNGYTSYFVPFPNASDIGKNDIIAVNIETRGELNQGHFFNLASNETQAPGAVTYFSGCGYGDTPIALENLANGFLDETIVNLIFTKPAAYTYQWDGDVDDPSSATPMAMGTSSATYNVTITDPCGDETIDAVEVDCWTVGTENLVDAAFTISPNPSPGVFQISNEGESKDIQIQVYDLNGKIRHQEIRNLKNGANEFLNLTHFEKGFYLAKLSSNGVVESHRLIIQ